jgi:tRNA-intron endonuclease
MNMMEIIFDNGTIWVEDSESVEKLKNDYFGEERSGKIFLTPEEALYLIKFRNGFIKNMCFTDLLSFFAKNDPKIFIKYNAYRDWRDRGLIIRRFSKVVKGKHEKKTYKEYPVKKLKLENLDLKAVWYPDSLFSLVEEGGKELFEKYWFGQYGIYKQTRGRILKLDFMETIFLSKWFGMKVFENGKQIKWENILKNVVKKREYAKQLYEVYEDWRLKGYVVKTGFKFGSHFRIYFPGASPKKGKSEDDEWVHSKHVLHVFPKEQKMLISEWARAIRVAHGVKKTFILGIPELKKEDYIDIPVDFLAYRRKKTQTGWVRETPKDKPRYLLAAFSEDDHIGGIELASLLEKAKSMGLSLILSITDRETAITYYVLKKIILPDSDYEYYEIEWIKP